MAGVFPAFEQLHRRDRHMLLCYPLFFFVVCEESERHLSGLLSKYNALSGALLAAEFWAAVRPLRSPSKPLPPGKAVHSVAYLTISFSHSSIR